MRIDWSVVSYPKNAIFLPPPVIRGRVGEGALSDSHCNNPISALLVYIPDEGSMLG